ncbi:MAG: leucine-rich repeat domain-containing protein [Promethearchaeota archaeon]
MKNLDISNIIDDYLEEGRDYSKKQFEEHMKEESSIDNLLEVYHYLENSKSKRATILKGIMENTIGGKYIEKYKIIPREAMALRFLELIVGKEVSKIDYHAHDDYWHFDFIMEEGHINGIFINEVYIEKINFLEFFPYLKNLRITIAGLKQIKGLHKLRYLKCLDLRANCITALPDLKDLVNLEVLSVGANPISSIKGIEQLKKLRSLDLDDTNLPKKYIKQQYDSLYGA